MEVLLEKLDRKVDEMRMTYQKMYKENQQLRTQLVQLDADCKKYQKENFELNDRLQKIEARLFKIISGFEKETLGMYNESVKEVQDEVNALKQRLTEEENEKGQKEKED